MFLYQNIGDERSKSSPRLALVVWSLAGWGYLAPRRSRHGSGRPEPPEEVEAQMWLAGVSPESLAGWAIRLLGVRDMALVGRSLPRRSRPSSGRPECPSGAWTAGAVRLLGGRDTTLDGRSLSRWLRHCFGRLEPSSGASSAGASRPEPPEEVEARL